MAEREQRLGEGSYQPEQPLLCANNCGFFGNPMCMNLCSKCYRDYTEQQKAAASIEQAATAEGKGGDDAGSAKQRSNDQMTASPSGSDALSGVPSSRAMSMDTSSTSEQQHQLAQGDRQSNEQRQEDECGAAAQCAATSSGVSDDLPERKVRKQRNRCFSCNKRVGLTGFPCRCGYVYCSVHRYSDKHDCAFDYKAAGRDAIAKANPTVVATKIDKI